MPKLDVEVEVEVLVDGEWRRSFADFRQRLDDGARRGTGSTVDDLLTKHAERRRC